MNIVSIDPGKDGAIAFNPEDGRARVYDLPLLPGKNSKRLDLGALITLIQAENFPEFVGIVEKVSSGPKMGSSAAFNFGYNYCVCYAALLATATSQPVVELPPRIWKSALGLINENKTASRKLALKLFPYLAPQFKFVKDTDRAEALLIGEAWVKLKSLEK